MPSRSTVGPPFFIALWALTSAVASNHKAIPLRSSRLLLLIVRNIVNSSRKSLRPHSLHAGDLNGRRGGCAKKTDYPPHNRERNPVSWRNRVSGLGLNGRAAF